VAELSLDVDQLVNARPETVWRLLTEPDLYVRWFGPDDARVTVEEMDVVLGGRFCVWITFAAGGSADGTDTDGGDGADVVVGIEGFYEVIEPPRQLVHTWRSMDEELVTTVRFDLEPVGERTRLTIHHRGFVDPIDLEQHRQGWTAHAPVLAELAASLSAALAADPDDGPDGSAAHQPGPPGRQEGTTP
jgi:uncharacterized protein YndB with AHSA1/START domain